MNINKNEIEHNLKLGLSELCKGGLQDFLKQIAERLEKMEQVLVVDRIENSIAVCEDRKSGKMKNILLSDLPENIKEGNILKWKNGKYEIDDSKEIEQRINQKMRDVWK